MDILKQLAKEFRNHPIGEEADTAFQTLKADAVAMNEVEASRLLEKYQLASATEKPGILKKLQKKHPESKFTRQAETP